MTAKAIHVFVLYICQANAQPHLGGGVMAVPRSVMIGHAGLSETLTNAPSNFQHWYIRSSSGNAYWPRVSL